MAKTRKSSPVKPLTAANRAEGFLHTSQTWWCSLPASAWCLLFSAQPCWFTSSCWSPPTLQSFSTDLPPALHSVVAVMQVLFLSDPDIYWGQQLICILVFQTPSIICQDDFELLPCVFWCAGSPSLCGVVCEYANIMLLRKILHSVTSQSEPWRLFLDIHLLLASELLITILLIYHFSHIVLHALIAASPRAYFCTLIQNLISKWKWGVISTALLPFTLPKWIRLL